MSFESSSSSRLCQLNQRLKIKALGSKSWRGSILGILIVKDAVSGVLVNFINFKQVIMILIWNGRRICIAFRQRQDNLECFICFFFFYFFNFFYLHNFFCMYKRFFLSMFFSHHFFLQIARRRIQKFFCFSFSWLMNKNWAIKKEVFLSLCWLKIFKTNFMQKAQ